MQKRILLLGLSGTGKSALMKKVVPDISKQLHHIIFGDIIRDIGAKKSSFKDRDEIRRETETAFFKEIQNLAFQKLEEMLDNTASELVVIDTHSFVSTKSGFLPGLPCYFLDRIKPSLIAFIESDPEEIRKRRIKDRQIGRRRDEDTIDILSLLQSASKTAAIVYSAYSGAPVILIKNEEGKLESAAQILKDAIENFEN